MAVAQQRVIVHTNIEDDESLAKRFAKAVDFANKVDAVLQAGRNNDGKVLYIVEARGETSAYCKGVVAEIKQLVKDAFNCKLEVLFYSY